MTKRRLLVLFVVCGCAGSAQFGSRLVPAQDSAQQSDPTDPGRPKLKHRKAEDAPAERVPSKEPAPRATTGGTSSTTTPESSSGSAQPATPPAPPAEGAGRVVVTDSDGRVVRADNSAASPAVQLVRRARESAAEFTEKLPNFVCDEHVFRYRSFSRVPDWQMQDRVTVEVVYNNGAEDYRNVKLNGKPLKKGSPEDSGTWSSGEFGSTLIDVLGSAREESFKYRGESFLAGADAKIYDYQVVKENAHWTIRFGKPVRPPYTGSVYIDPKSARVLRIEMQTKQLPSDYELDTVEGTVDYDWVLISGRKFLLPTRSENLACFKGTYNCVRNVIEFRNYRKFDAESSVMTTESEISFPDADQPAGDKTSSDKTSTDKSKTPTKKK